MGGFYGSTHIRMDSNQPVKQVLSELAAKEGLKCYLSPAINGWVAVYNEGHGQIPFGGLLAKHFSQDILSVVVHEDSVFYYWYYKERKLMDHYDSCPDYFGETLSAEKLEKCKAHPEVFSDLLADPKQFSALQHILCPEDKEYTVTISQDDLQANSEPEVLNIIYKELIDDPTIFAKFFKDQDPLTYEKFMTVTTPLVQQGKSPPEIYTETAKYPELMDSYHAILKQYIELKHKELNHRSHQKPTDTVVSYQKSAFQFASEQMIRFADLLGIKNILTAYEYLEQGETEDIENFADFIKIPG